MIYLDHAATTPLDRRVLEKMLPYLTDIYFNPSLSYRASVKTRSAIYDARKTLGEIIGAKPENIIFTAGGTEADNYAIKGFCRANCSKGRHIISSKIEHPAVLNSLKQLEKEGFQVSYVPVNDKGRIDAKDIEKLIRPDTILVSIMFANNETGVIQPIKEIGILCKEKGIVFHSDGVQAFCHVPVNVDEYGIDMFSTSAHKIYGPKGVGFLYIRDGIKLENIISGGEQEQGIRPGTENVASIIGMAEAAKIINESLNERIEKEKKLSEMLIQGIIGNIDRVKVNSDLNNRLPGSVNFTFEGIEGESLMIQLDMKGICASTGSACSQGLGEPSHVLKAMGLSDEEAKGSLRLTVGYENTEEEMNSVVKCLKEIVDFLRMIRIA